MCDFIGGLGYNCSNIVCLESAKIFIMSSLLVSDRLNLNHKKRFLQMFSSCLV